MKEPLHSEQRASFVLILSCKEKNVKKTFTFLKQINYLASIFIYLF